MLELALLGGGRVMSTHGTIMSLGLLWYSIRVKWIHFCCSKPIFNCRRSKGCSPCDIEQANKLPTTTPFPLIKLSMTVPQWILGDLKAVLSNGCVQLLVWLGSLMIIISSFCFANSTNSTLLWEPWPSQIRNCARAGPMFLGKCVGEPLCSL